MSDPENQRLPDDRPGHDGEQAPTTADSRYGRLRARLQNKTLRSFMHVLGGNALTTLSQGLQFLLLARLLGPAEFGRVATVGSICALLMPFSGVGSANVMVMRASRDPSVLPLYLGNAFVTMILSGSVLVVVAVLGVEPLLHEAVSLEMMAVFGISELLASKVVDICWQAFIANEKPRYISVFLGAQSVSRLLAAAIFMLVIEQPDAWKWTGFALASNTLVAGWVLARTLREIGPLRFDMRLMVRELSTGIFFAMGLAARSFYTDADKIFLARFAGTETVGYYTMAYRVVQISVTAIRALSMSLRARLFRVGAEGIAGTLKIALSVMRPLAGGAFVLGVGFYITAPLLPFIAGERYAVSVDVLRVLCMLPLVLSVQTLLDDTIATSGNERVAAVSQVLAGILVCLVCATLIPLWGWHGAAIAAYSAQAFLCFVSVFTIRYFLRIAAPVPGSARL